MAVDSVKATPSSHKPHEMKGQIKHHQQPKDKSKDITAIKSAREVTRKPKDITNKPRASRDSRDIANVDVKYYPKKVNMADRSQIENHSSRNSHMESSRVTEYTSNDIQVTSHKLEPIQLRPVVPQQDSIHVTSHKITTAESQQVDDSPSQRLLRRKQQTQQVTTTKAPEVYLLDLDEVKVHKVKRIFKLGKKDDDDTPRRCHSEERARRRTWHPTDTDRSTRSDGDVVTGRSVRAPDDFSPLGEERSSRPRQRRSAFMESIHSFFGSRKSTSSPVKSPKSSQPQSAPTSPLSLSQSPGPEISSPHSQHEEHHVARAVGGKYQGQQLKYDRVRHLAEENEARALQRPKSWDKSVTSPVSPLAEVSRASVNNKSSSLPPNQQPPKEDIDDKNHVIFGMGEKTFKRFSKYLTVYDDPPESRV